LYIYAMKKHPLLLGAAALAASCGQEAQQPNIVFFLIDDNGWVDSNVAYGEQQYPNNLRYDTPNMLRLAEEGVRFGAAYACPVSTPTRTSLLTGVNAVHSRITNWTAPYKDTPSDGKVAEGDKLHHGDWNWNGVCPEDFADQAPEHSFIATPYPQLLKEAGYYTIHVGKAHWASCGTPGANPHNMGFCVNIAGGCIGRPASYLGEKNYGNNKQDWNIHAVQNLDEYYSTPTFLTEALTLEALKALDEPISKGQPFFLNLAHYATHTPLEADARFYQKYIDRGFDEQLAKYASMVEGVDKSLGDLYNYLEDKGVLDNTIIILMTDNGAKTDDSENMGGEVFCHNKPLRYGKGSCYEGGIRVPLTIRWKGHAKAGARVTTPVICEDLFPTILEMAGIKNYGTLQELDGQSIVPLLNGKSKESDRELVFGFPHKWKKKYDSECDFIYALRKGDWKLVWRMWDERYELYNLADDLGEQHDVAAENPDIVNKLKTALDTHLADWDSPLPEKLENERIL